MNYSKKQYESAKRIVEAYENKLFKQMTMPMEEVKQRFPIGQFVVSKLNSAVRGVVYDYTYWANVPQLLCRNNEGKKVRILIHNAIPFEIGA